MSGLCQSPFYLMCDFIVFKSHPLWLLSNWKPDGKHLVSPSGGRGIYVSVCDSVYACPCQRQTNNGSYTRRADVRVWPPWSCLCPPFIKIIDKEHRGTHLLQCGSVIGLILRPLNHTLSIYFPKSVSGWSSLRSSQFKTNWLIGCWFVVTHGSVYQRLMPFCVFTAFVFRFHRGAKEYPSRHQVPGPAEQPYHWD